MVFILLVSTTNKECFSDSKFVGLANTFYLDSYESIGFMIQKAVYSHINVESIKSFILNGKSALTQNLQNSAFNTTKPSF